MAYEVSNQEESLRKGPWLEEEDETLVTAVALLGERRWDALAKESGLRRSGKSCRLRWLNYLRPNLKHGEITEEEELIIIHLHQQWGNKWAKIARRLPGRTDNEIKNYWKSHLRKKIVQTQEQEQDPSVQLYGGFMQISNGNGDCTYVKSCISSTSDNSLSSADNELSNKSFGRSPYEGRVSEWASSCWLYDQSQRRKDENLDNYSSSSTFSYPSWSFEEESDSSIWDCSTSFWS